MNNLSKERIALLQNGIQVISEIKDMIENENSKFIRLPDIYFDLKGLRENLIELTKVEE